MSTATQPAVPAEKTGDQPPTVPGTPVAPLTLDDQLVALAEAGREEAADTDDARPQIRPTPKMMEIGKRWYEGKGLDDVISASLKKDAEALDKMCFDAWVKALFDSKQKPINPEFNFGGTASDPDVQVIYQVKDCKVKVPKSKTPMTIKQNVINTLTTLFAKAGVSETDAKADAKKVADQAVMFVKTPYIMQPEDFQDEDEKKVAYKYLALILWDGTGSAPPPLTEKDRQLLVTSKWEAIVREGAEGIICKICRTEKQLAAAFEVIVPATAFTKPKFKTDLTGAELDTISKRIVAEARPTT